MPRLYCSHSLKDPFIQLTGEQAHYLLHVLRLKEGDRVHLFNSLEGEWAALITARDKKSVTVQIQDLIRSPQEGVPLHLIFSPLKSDAMGWLMEKSTELGVTDFWPVKTDYTGNRFNETRAALQVMMAVQQCERLILPSIHPYQPLPQLLASWERQGAPLFVALERFTEGVSLLTVDLTGSVALVVGPEGGFSEREHQYLIQHPLTTVVSLGSVILRADTAAITLASAALLQRLSG